MPATTRPPLRPFWTISLLLASLWLALPAVADWADGVAAFNRGDYSRAAEEWRPLAEAGDPEAQFGIGFLYDEGLGVPQDVEAALRWYLLAAAQDNVRAINNVGLMFFTGVPGIEQDYAEALRWYLRAAELGDPDAQFNVGLIYENGLGVPQDPAEAMKWFALSAEQGDLDAQDHLDRLRAAADKQATATSSQ